MKITTKLHKFIYFLLLISVNLYMKKCHQKELEKKINTK